LAAVADEQRVVARAAESRRSGARHLRWRNVSLLWRVFAANVAICVIAVALLAWTPATVHRVATPSELLVLSSGLVVMLAIDLLILRRVFAPLRRLAAMMGTVEPGQPGRRADTPPSSGGEVVALADALNSMLDRLEHERLESGRRALAAQEGERSRIARELHDEVGQTLTAVALQAQRAAREPSHQNNALDEIAQTVLRSLEDVHRIGRELRPEALDDLGLVNALIALCSRLGRHADVRIRRDLHGELPPLSGEVELVIYRVAQEALTNALRHANATEVRISLAPAADRVVLAVSDDGRGMPEHVTESGIAGMRERAMLIGAELEIRSRTGRGTQVVLAVPAAAR
jgi:two-component system, NarL family, sensor histidine kinase UhpB